MGASLVRFIPTNEAGAGFAGDATGLRGWGCVAAGRGCVVAGSGRVVAGSGRVVAGSGRVVAGERDCGFTRVSRIGGASDASFTRVSRAAGPPLPDIPEDARPRGSRITATSPTGGKPTRLVAALTLQCAR